MKSAVQSAASEPGRLCRLATNRRSAALLGQLNNSAPGPSIQGIRDELGLGQLICAELRRKLLNALFDGGGCNLRGLKSDQRISGLAAKVPRARQE